ncbi:MAG: GDP-mannose 4,6-dehydratase, partial [Polyangiaceae bacterium]
DQMERACEGIEVVLHLAALISIPYSYSAADSYLDTNVRGSMNVFRAALKAKVARIVHTSTSEVYGTPKDLPIRETHPLQAQSPYAATKVAADQMAQAFHLSHDLPVVTLRPFNTYGPRQSTRAILSTILVQLISGKREILLGRLDPRRDLTFVRDTVDGFLRAAVAPDIVGETIQLGTGRAVSIGELFEVCQKVVGVRATVREDARRVRPSRSEVMVLQSDPTRARDLLQWTPSTSLEEGIRMTAAWLRDNLPHYNVDRFHV